MADYTYLSPPNTRLNARDRAALDAVYGAMPAPVLAAPQLQSGPDPFLGAVKRFEGFAPKAKWDYRQYSSGYGTKAAYAGEAIDPQTAESRLQDEWYKAGQVVDRVNPNLDPGTRAALTSLTYNTGANWVNQSLGQKIAAGDLEGAKPIFTAYNRAGGQVLQPLVNRRQEEASWFGQQAPPGSTPVPPEQTATRYGQGETPALGTPPAPALPTPSQPVPSAPAAALGGLGGLLARLVGAQPTLAPAAGVLGIPGQPPQGAPASPMGALSAYQPEQPPPLQMPDFQQLQFAGQQPLRLQRPKVQFGRGFY